MKTIKSLLTIALFLLIIPQLLASVIVDPELINYPDPEIEVILTTDAKITQEELSNDSDLVGLEFENEFLERHVLTPDEQLSNGLWTLSFRTETPAATTSPFYQTSFRVSGLQIRSSQEGLFADGTPFDLSFNTFVESGNRGDDILFNAACEYYLGEDPQPNLWNPMVVSNTQSDDNQFSGDEDVEVGARHTAQGLENQGTISVRCESFRLDGESTGFVQEQFEYGFYEEGPSIEITANPEQITKRDSDGRGKTTVTAETNHRATCTIRQLSDGETQELVNVTPDETLHQKILYFTEETGDQEFRVSCENRAGLDNNKDITININYSLPVDMGVLAPADWENDDEVEVHITTQVPSKCTTADGTALTQSESEFTHKRTFTGHTQGVLNQFNVTCLVEDNPSRNETRLIQYQVDTTPPTNQQITTQGLICGDRTTSALVNATDEHSGVAWYHWRITDNSGSEIASGNKSGPGLVEIAQEIPQGIDGITWHLITQDLAGNNATEISEQTMLRPGVGGECNEGEHFIQYDAPDKGHIANPPRANIQPTIQTLRPVSACGYIRQPVSSDDPNFIAASQENEEGTVWRLGTITASNTGEYWLQCIEDNEFETVQDRKHMPFGVNQGSLEIIGTIDITPEKITDFQQLHTNISFETNHKAVCELIGPGYNDYFEGQNSDIVSTYTRSHEHNLDLTDVVDDTSTRNLQYNLQCYDLANQQLSESKTFVLLVDFTNIDIEVLSPEPYTQDESITFSVQPQTTDTTTCRIRTGSNSPLQEMTQTDSGANIWSYTPQTTFEEGSYQDTFVVCENSLGEESTQAITFTIDRTPPIITFSGSSQICLDSDAILSTITVDDSSPINLTVNEEQIATNEQATNNEYSYSLSLDDVAVGTTTITATAIDMAGNAQTQTKEVSVYEEHNPICEELGVHCSVTSDCPSGHVCVGGACSATIPCSEGDDCPNNFVCGEDSNICVDPTCPGEVSCPSGEAPYDVTTIDGCSIEICVSEPPVECTANEDCSQESSCDTELNVCVPTVCSATLSCPSGYTKEQVGTSQTGCPLERCIPNDSLLDEEEEPPFEPPTTDPSDGSTDDDFDFGDSDTQDPDTPSPGVEEPGVPEDTSGFPWLALLLIIFGTVLVGGSGYYLYFEYNERQIQAQRRSNQGGFNQNSQGVNGPRGPQPLTPEQQARMKEQLAQRQKAREQAHQQHLQEKEAKRKAIASAFEDDSGSSPQQKGTSQQVQPQKTPQQQSNTDTNEQKPSQTTRQDDDYVLLGGEKNTTTNQKADSLHHAKESIKETKKDSEPQEKKKKSAFDELDDLLEDK